MSGRSLQWIPLRERAGLYHSRRFQGRLCAGACLFSHSAGCGSPHLCPARACFYNSGRRLRRTGSEAVCGCCIRRYARCFLPVLLFRKSHGEAHVLEAHVDRCVLDLISYSGMLDMYSDFTMFQAQTGAHLQVLEMCDLDKHLQKVTDEEVAEKRREIEEFFVISEDDAADPLAQKPTEEQLNWSAKVAVAQEKLVEEFDLDALTYYYHGAPGNHYEDVQGGFIVGHSLLTAEGIPCAGEGDLKTCLAMKICDIIGKGGSFCEIVTTDYEDGTILLGHDGPIMTIGNTQTPVKFKTDPDTYMDKWFAEAPTHHFAMSVGHNVGVFIKVADLLEIPQVVLE